MPFSPVLMKGVDRVVSGISDPMFLRATLLFIPRSLNVSLTNVRMLHKIRIKHGCDASFRCRALVQGLMVGLEGLVSAG